MNRKTLLMAAALALAAVPALATIRIQKEAEGHGYPAANCGYCHTFDSNHMKEEAAKQGRSVRGLDCYVCHGRRLPKSGSWLLNERGLFLTRVKQQFRADRVDGAWLKNYREPAPAKKAAK
ncbi:MAG TPA: hypothetical protein VFO85_15340 [Vicinamibacteria bacterium]|nr:hypothetical protein [Vicinamibacteria bacterium]